MNLCNAQDIYNCTSRERLVSGAFANERQICYKLMHRFMDINASNYTLYIRGRIYARIYQPPLRAVITLLLVC